jgi:predicted extracellular nuclease
MGIDNITIKGTIVGPPQLVISEIMYNPASAEDNWEWVEVYNAGITDVNLAGFVIDDINGTAHTSSNIAGGIIPAGGSGVLYNADDLTASQFTDAWGMVNLIPVTNWGAMALNNGGDTVGIWDSFTSYIGDNQTQLNVIDNVAYDDFTPWPSDNNSASIFLNDLASDNDIGSNWILSTDGAVTPLYNAYTSNAAGGNSGNDVGSPGILSSGMLPLLLSEITVTPTAGEFIEIHNPNAVAVDLTDVYLTDATFASGGVFYYNIVTGSNAGGGGFGDFLARFPNGATISPGEYLTVSIAGSIDYFNTYGVQPDYELYEDDGTPDAIPDMLEGLPGSINNQGGLTNSGEIAILFYWDGQSDLVTDLDYVVWGDKAEAVDKTGVAIDGPDADTTTSTYANDTPIANQEVVALSSHSIGDSFQRDDLTEGNETDTGSNGINGEDETSEDLGNTWCVSGTTAGLPNVCGPVVVPLSFVHEVQGSGLTAAMAGSTVRVEAIVIADYQNTDQLRGFFVQEEDTDADADNTTSEGIFVYCDSCPTSVSVGDLVEVTGLAEDYFGMTQIDLTAPGSVLNNISSGNVLPSPASISLPATTSTEAEGTFENVEGMLINVITDLVVSEYFELARYGQLVLSANNRVRQFTDSNEPDVAGYAAYLDQLDRTRIILDDDNNIQNDAINGPVDEAYFWPRPGLSISNLIRGGDQITNLQGVMHWSFAGQSGTDAWRIRPVEEAFTYDFNEVNSRPVSPEDVGGDFKVASFNVLNYFTTLDERGANSIVELDRQREKIAAAICDMNADVIGLIELENNGPIAMDDLLNGPNGINAQCSSTYAMIDTGVLGSDQITTGFIYNSATVAPQGSFAVLDSSVDPRFNDDRNRPALAQTFTRISTGGTLTLVVNHLKSKGSSCDDIGDPDINDGSGNCNLTRTSAAEAMVDWLATDPTNSGDPDFMIIGDLNSYRNETPIDAIKNGSDDILGTSDDFVDLLDFFLGSDAYSYVFDGQIGYLDHALVNQSLFQQITGATSWHINADEVNVFDYNDGIQDPGEASFNRKSNALPIYEANAFRASDHDPLLIGIDLGVPPVIVCPSSIVVDNSVGQCGAIVIFSDAIATDVDGDLDTVIQTGGLPSGSLFPVGDSIIEFTATDLAGHISVCTFTITVVDAEPANAVCNDITIQLDTNGFASINDTDIDGGSTDNCGIDTIVASQTDFDCSDVGETSVILTVTDIHGNTSTCTAIVTVEDVTSPIAQCQDIVAELDENGIIVIDPSQIDNGSSDACGIETLELDQETFDCSHIGENNVVLTVTDFSGNSSSCTAIITIVDSISPDLECMDITLELDENGMATITPNDVIANNSDACGIDTTAVDITDFDCSDIGTPVTVNVFSSDVNGNLSSCTAVVTVVDNMVPELICPEDQTVDPGQGNLYYVVPDYFAIGEAIATDNCTDPVTDTSQDPAAGTELSDGIYTVVITATDDYGNTATCEFELIVESVLGIGEVNLEESIILYPNPSESILNLVNTSGLILGQTRIYDINGRMILNIDLDSRLIINRIDVSQLSSGWYMIEVQGDDSVVTRRFIKE